MQIFHMCYSFDPHTHPLEHPTNSPLVDIFEPIYWSCHISVKLFNVMQWFLQWNALAMNTCSTRLVLKNRNFAILYGYHQSFQCYSHSEKMRKRIVNLYVHYNRIYLALLHYEGQENGTSLEATFSSALSRKKVWILIQVLHRFFPLAQLTRPALVQIMAWQTRGDRSASEPIMAKFTDAYNLDERLIRTN